METSCERYLREHCNLHNDALDWIEKQTNIRTNYPRMLSGRVQGQFLKMMVEVSGSRNVLEIGTFTGYSACCMALGLPPDGHIDALEINDELEDLILEGWSRAGVADRISLHIGDACSTLQTLKDRVYDLVFIDANKRQYCSYYDLVFPLVRPGGLIIADDVLWDGKVYADQVPGDKQTTGVVQFNDMVTQDRRVEQFILPLRDGLNIIRKI